LTSFLSNLTKQIEWYACDLSWNTKACKEIGLIYVKHFVQLTCTTFTKFM